MNKKKNMQPETMQNQQAEHIKHDSGHGNHAVTHRRARTAKDAKGTIKRLLSYLGKYKLRFTLVIVFVIISSVVTAISSTFIQSLIDDYITPLVTQNNPDLAGLAHYIIQILVIFLIGAFAGYMYQRLMVVVSQGIQKKIRDDMFEHMQKLPIRYFDTHTHGDIMSHYTNDVDTLRQMLSQSIPMILSSSITIIAVFIAMLSISIWLTLVVVAFCVIIFATIGFIAGQSGKYFLKQVW